MIKTDTYLRPPSPDPACRYFVLDVGLGPYRLYVNMQFRLHLRFFSRLLRRVR